MYILQDQYLTEYFSPMIVMREHNVDDTKVGMIIEFIEITIAVNPM